MPRIQLQDPYGMPYRIDTRSDETLRAWFDEILPLVRMTNEKGRLMYPQIMVMPLLLPEQPPDWLMDARVLGRAHIFQAVNGERALAELANLRSLLEAELRTLRV